MLGPSEYQAYFSNSLLHILYTGSWGQAYIKVGLRSSSIDFLLFYNEHDILKEAFWKKNQ